MTSKIINNHIIYNDVSVMLLENSKVFKDLEYKCKKSEYNRRYYLKNRERLIKENVKEEIVKEVKCKRKKL